MQPGPKYVNVGVYDPGKQVFQVSLLTKNIPGALGDIATLVGKAGVNIMSMSNHSEPNNPQSTLSFFGETEDKGMTEEGFRKVLSSSSYVLDVYVKKAETDFVVDDYSFPLTYFPAGRGVLFPQKGLSSMFEDMVSLFGSGGEAILFRAGYSVGREGTGELAKVFGEEAMLSAAGVFTKLCNALGWGKMDVEEASGDFTNFRLKFEESFECSGARSDKPRGHFTRGLIAGAAERLLGKPVDCVEEMCAAVGDPHCAFRVSLR